MKTRAHNIVLLMFFFGILFFLIGFALGINAYLIPMLKEVFNLSSIESYYVLAASYAAFVLFGYPSGKIILRFGYKKSMFISFILFCVGFFLFIPSNSEKSFVLFLLASFISGMGNTLLQAVVNPYITNLGDRESAAKRICIMGITNKIAWAVAPIFLGLFLDLENIQLPNMLFPLYIILGILAFLGLASLFIPLPELKIPVEDETSYQKPNRVSVFHYPHLLLGILALFLYSGVECIALASIVDFAVGIGLQNPESYTSYTVFFMCIGYVFGIVLIPRFISQKKALTAFSIVGVFSVLLILIVPCKIAFWFIALLGFANSIMWPAIWPLALNKLGSFTKEGASLLVMGITGGAVFPLLFGWMNDLLTSGGFNGIQMAYFICLPVYLYIYYYSAKGCLVGI